MRDETKEEEEEQLVRTRKRKGTEEGMLKNLSDLLAEKRKRFVREKSVEVEE